MTVKTLEAAAILTGTTIGAGILGIPFIAAKAGVLTTVIVILIVGALMLYINMAIGEMVLSTKEQHQLTGLAQKFLGRRGKQIMALGLMLTTYGAIIAYLIGIGQVLQAIFSGPQLLYSVGVWLLVAFLVFKGIDLVAGVELGIASFVVLLVVVMGLASVKAINIANIAVFKPGSLFQPFGIVLFAFMGMVAIPEMVEELKDKKQKLKKAILAGFIPPLILYLLFPVYVVGVTGANTTDVATVGLGNALGEAFNLFGNLFAFLAMLTSFIALSFALVEMYRFDYNLSHKASFSLSTVLPLVVFLLIKKFAGFHNVLSVTGALAGGLMGVLIMVMLGKLKTRQERNPELKVFYNKWLSALICLLFMAGAVLVIL